MSTTGVLNAVVPRLRAIAAPAAGVLVLTSLPFRLLEIHFIDLLLRLGNDALHYGNLLVAVSSLTVVAFVVSLYGRAVFIRACHTPPRTWRQLLTVDPRAFLAYVYVAMMIQLVLVLLAPTLIAIPLVVMLAGVAAAASTDAPRLGLFAPLRALSIYLQDGRVLGGLMFVFAIAYAAVLANLVFLVRAGLWAAGAIPGFDPQRWSLALGSSMRIRYALLATAVAIVEPFFLTAMHVHADRVRSRQSGQDLIRRFEMLANRKELVAAIAIAFFLCVPAHAQQRTIDVRQYAGALQTIRDDLAAGRFADAAAAAADLNAVDSVTAAGTRFAPDHALLRDAADRASHSQPDVVLIGRLDSTIAAFGGAGIRTAQPAPDPKLLQRIRDAEKVGELPRGGELRMLGQTSPTVGDEIARIFQNVIDWLAAKLEWLFDWIAKMWPSQRPDEEKRATFFGVPVVVWVVTSLVVATMLLLAISVLRRSKRRAVTLVSEAVATSDADADPLSREANEWERYAADLAASGRLREAIRAWYHAVLMTLVRSGILHYRKGVTNWEYITALSPAFEWRPRFVSITQLFERQWYGHRDTTADVLDSCALTAREILTAVRQGPR